MFPRYVQGLENGDYTFLQPEHLTYYRNCIMTTNEYLTRPENVELLKWIRRRGKDHVGLTGATDYAYCGLMYQLFEFQPFAGILDTEIRRAHMRRKFSGKAVRKGSGEIREVRRGSFAAVG